MHVSSIVRFVNYHLGLHGLYVNCIYYLLRYRMIHVCFIDVLFIWVHVIWKCLFTDVTSFSCLVCMYLHVLVI